MVPLVNTVTSGASWGEDGNILLDHLAGNGLMLIQSGGGAATPVTELASGELAHAEPHILPGGKAVLFTVYRGSVVDVNNASIDVISLADHRRKTLVQGGTSPHYVATSNGTGHLVYNHNGTLFAISFDLTRLETRGSAVPILGRDRTRNGWRQGSLRRLSHRHAGLPQGKRRPI